MEISLSYLPRGLGIIIGGYANGSLMDWNYKSTAERIGHAVNKEHGDDIGQFPIESARTRVLPSRHRSIQAKLGASVYTFFKHVGRRHSLRILQHCDHMMCSGSLRDCYCTASDQYRVERLGLHLIRSLFRRRQSHSNIGDPNMGHLIESFTNSRQAS